MPFSQITPFLPSVETSRKVWRLPWCQVVRKVWYTGKCSRTHQWCLDFSFSLDNTKNTTRFTGVLSHILFHRVIIYAHFSVWNERKEHPSFYTLLSPEHWARKTCSGVCFSRLRFYSMCPIFNRKSLARESRVFSSYSSLENCLVIYTWLNICSQNQLVFQTRCWYQFLRNTV